MTRQKSFKRLVRARMEKTGESYTAARAALLAAEEPKATEGPALSMSDEAIRRRTGRGWEEWFDLLDEWGAAERPHREIARWVADEHGIDGLGRAGGDRQLRARPRSASGRASTPTASRSPPRRPWRCRSSGCTTRSWTSRCAGAGCPTTGSASAPPRGQSRARFDWGDGETRVIVGFEAKGEAKSVVALAARAAPRRRGGGADEGLLARAGRGAEGGAGGMSEVRVSLPRPPRTVPPRERRRRGSGRARG